jgi:hypothetical protein
MWNIIGFGSEFFTSALNILVKEFSVSFPTKLLSLDFFVSIDLMLGVGG